MTNVECHERTSIVATNVDHILGTKVECRERMSNEECRERMCNVECHKRMSRANGLCWMMWTKFKQRMSNVMSECLMSNVASKCRERMGHIEYCERMPWANVWCRMSRANVESEWVMLNIVNECRERMLIDEYCEQMSNVVIEFLMLNVQSKYFMSDFAHNYQISKCLNSNIANECWMSWANIECFKRISTFDWNCLMSRTKSCNMFFLECGMLSQLYTCRLKYIFR